MASHQQNRIQAYLEKNKIGPLFEELMTKLITETPDQPIPFLIDHLQSKQGGHSQLQRTLSGSAALWAESETSENKGTRRDIRSYDKPWQTNAKKPKKSKSDLAVSNISPPSPESKSLPGSIEHPKWDWRSKSEHRDFDELNHILQESKKLGKALENLSRSITISDELDKDAATFNSPLLWPRVVGEWVGREENDADPLADEMLQPPIPRSKMEQWDSEDSGSPGGSLKMEPKTKGLKHQQQQHKKLLAAMLSQDSFDSVQSTAPSVTEEDIDNEDDAMELLGAEETMLYEVGLFPTLVIVATFLFLLLLSNRSHEKEKKENTEQLNRCHIQMHITNEADPCEINAQPEVSADFHCLQLTILLCGRVFVQSLITAELQILYCILLI